jgi:putative transposase
MSRTIEFSVGEWYHCYNRGVDKRKVFLGRKDYERFLALLYLGNSPAPIRLDNLAQFQQGLTLLERAYEEDRKETLVDVGAYCLMPNHFHLLLHEKEEGGITQYMQKIGTGYTMHINKREERTGSLFGGTFKAQHVADDRYFKRVVNYIHANSAELVEPKWKEGVIKARRKQQRFLPPIHTQACLNTSAASLPLTHHR